MVLGLNTVATNIVLGDWSAESIDGFSQGQYMATYAGLGLGLALLTFLSGAALK